MSGPGWRSQIDGRKKKRVRTLLNYNSYNVRIVIYGWAGLATFNWLVRLAACGYGWHYSPVKVGTVSPVADMAPVADTGLSQKLMLIPIRM